MPTVEFTLAGQIHTISCEAGEEQRIRALASSTNQRVRNLEKQLPGATGSLALALTALMMEDEIGILKRGENTDTSQMADVKVMEDAVADVIEDTAVRIEVLAKRLQTG